jgi:hypothetical protein
MASGSTPEVEISNLILEWRTMLDSWEHNGQGPLDFSFFDLRTFSLPHLPQDYLYLTHTCFQYLQSCKMSTIWNSPGLRQLQLMITPLTKTTW